VTPAGSVTQPVAAQIGAAQSTPISVASTTPAVVPKVDAVQSNGPGSIFGPIDDIRKSIQRYRDKFIFTYDK